MHTQKNIRIRPHLKRKKFPRIAFKTLWRKWHWSEKSCVVARIINSEKIVVYRTAKFEMKEVQILKFKNVDNYRDMTVFLYNIFVQYHTYL
jgi:hypothetical protein